MVTSFVLNPWMALAGLPLIPVLIWFLLCRQTSRLVLVGGLIFLVFSKGTLEILGLSTTTTRLVSEGIIIVLFLLTFIGSSQPRKHLPGLFWLITFITIAFLSVIDSKANLKLLIFFYRDYLFVILFLYCVLNLSFSTNETRTLSKLLVLLFLSQIVANIIKYFVMGTIMEQYIGSMANLGGSLTIIFALVGSAICITLYLHTKNLRYLMVFLGFILFSVLGGKRATVVFMPILYLAMVIFHQKQHGIKLHEWFKQAVLIFIVSITLVYVAVRLLPSLNPEQTVWGPFDLEYAIEYSTRYVTTEGGGIERVGRIRAPGYLVDMAALDSLDRLLLGYGAGHLIKSRFNPAIAVFGSQSDITMDLYGVGYGARTAFLQFFLQVGLFGVISYLGLWVCIYRSSIRIQRNTQEPSTRRLAALALFGLFFVFAIDFFTYSVVMVKISSVSLAFCLIVAFTRNPALVDVFIDTMKRLRPRAGKAN
jgi:hypothetical protein